MCDLCWCFALGYVNGKIYIQIYLSILRERPLAVWCSYLMYKRRAAEEDHTRLAALSTGKTHFWYEDNSHIEALVHCALLPMTGQFQDQVPDYVINIKYVLEGILIPIIGSIGVWGNLCKSRIRSMLLCVHCVGKIVV